MMFPNIYPSSAQLQSGTCRSHQISRAVSPGWASLPICGALGQAGTTTEGEQQEIGGFNRQQGQIGANRGKSQSRFEAVWEVKSTRNFWFWPIKISMLVPLWRIWFVSHSWTDAAGRWKKHSTNLTARWFLWSLAGNVHYRTRGWAWGYAQDFTSWVEFSSVDLEPPKNSTMWAPTDSEFVVWQG